MTDSLRSISARMPYSREEYDTLYKLLVNPATKDRDFVAVIYNMLSSPHPSASARFFLRNLIVRSERSSWLTIKIESVFSKVIFKAVSNLSLHKPSVLIVDLLNFLLKINYENALFFARHLLETGSFPIFVSAALCQTLPKESLESLEWLNLKHKEILEYAFKFPERIALDKYYLRLQTEIVQDQVSLWKKDLQKSISTGFDDGLCFGYACTALLGEEPTDSKVRYFQAFHLLNLATKESYEEVEFPKLKRGGQDIFIKLDEFSYPIESLYMHLVSLRQDEILLSLEDEEACHLLYVDFKEEILIDYGQKHSCPPEISFKIFLNAYVHLEYHYPCTKFAILPIILSN